ncbi:C2H2-type zinc finger protein [Halobacterium zhouii]|uniref:C2H2-type zinc finger protein n=1 Tax=Halobacterium zhouii TaxID=2902624 RepID=UPI001E4EAA96|nr:C2H2-type zinc finger protein [Halobacterium zhouii]
MTRTRQNDQPADAPRCSHCGEAFPTDQLRDLHRGLEHYDALADDEREAFDEAYIAETEGLRSFRLRALAALVLVYFGFLFAYAVMAVG